MYPHQQNPFREQPVTVAFPAIVSDNNNSSQRGIVADWLLDGMSVQQAAKRLKKQGWCFSLAHFLMLGRMPRRPRHA